MAQRFWADFGQSPEVGQDYEGVELEQKTTRVQAYLTARFTDLRNEKWADLARGFVGEALRDGVSLSAYLGAINGAAQEGHQILAEKLSDDFSRSPGSPPA